jgi:16S rRNA processing protein RimM
MRLFEIGTVVNTQGLKGEVRVLPTTDDPTRFELLEEIELFTKNSSKIYKIQSLRYHKQFVILKLVGIDNMDDAEQLKTRVIKINEDKALPLLENEFYIRDLYNISVVTVEGENLGKITDIIANTNANDVYVVKNTDSSEILIPALKQCILNVDITKNIMTVKLLKGLR